MAASIANTFLVVALCLSFLLPQRSLEAAELVRVAQSDSRAAKIRKAQIRQAKLRRAKLRQAKLRKLKQRKLRAQKKRRPRRARPSRSAGELLVLKKYFKKKKYLAVLKIFKRVRSKKELLRNPQALVILSVSAEKANQHSKAALYYYQLLRRKQGKLLKAIKLRMAKGRSIPVKKIPKSFKVLAWKVSSNFYLYLKKASSIDGNFNKLNTLFNNVANMLIELEFRDDKVDQMVTLVNDHIDQLKRDKSTWQYYVRLDYLSWQREASIEKNDNTTKGELVVTNTGTCIGGGLSYQNYYRSFSLDGCLVLGLGNVSENTGVATYQQENILAFGAKIAPSFSLFVSERRAELGVRLPLFVFSQELESPPNFTVDGRSSVQLLMSVYSKWPIGDYFVATEFSRFVGQDTSMWSLGLGKSF